VNKLGGWNGSNAANRSGNFLGGGRAQSVSIAGGLCGTLLERRDLGSSRGIDLRDFSDAMLAVMFVAAGCDYCDSLKGIGVATARNIVKEAFHGEARLADDAEPVLRVILDELYRSCHRDAREKLLPLEDPEKEEVRSEYERSFLAAVAMFRHPIVYDPILGAHVVANDVCDDSGASTCSSSFLRDERVLMEYRPYRDLVTDREMLYQAVGTPFAPEAAKGIAEGLVDPRQVPEQGAGDTSGRSAPLEDGRAAAQEDGHSQEEDEGAGGEYADLTQGSSGLQLASQDFSGAGTQQSSSAASGFISSLSPDLLASPSPQKQS